jgi:ABC-type glycerol-3-phosphate transport system permease component
MTYRRNYLLTGTKLALALAWVVFALFPLYQMVLVSLMPFSSFLQSPLYTSPSTLTLSNYADAFANGQIPIRMYLNSGLVAVLAASTSTVLAALAGYSFARFKFFGSRLLSRSILLIYIVPPILFLVPIYVLMVRASLYNTYQALIIVHTVLILPFSIWLLRGFFRDIPPSLDEAARVDGASRLRVLRYVVLPLALPGIATVFVFGLIESWNEFLYASVLIASQNRKTFPVGLYSVAGTLGDVRWGETMAAATAGAIPMLILFLIAQRFLVSGLTSGAVKG